MQVILIRHGKTAGNTRLEYIGRTDQPLCEEGIKSTKEAGADLSVESVWVSALCRTRQTAELLFPNARQITEPDFNEMDFGKFEGKNFGELENDADYRAWIDSGCTSRCPGGESRAEFSERVCAAFLRAVKKAAETGAEQAVFTVHGGTIMAVMERFARPVKDYYSYAVKNCGGYCCIVSADENGDIFLSDISSWGGNQSDT